MYFHTAGYKQDSNGNVSSWAHPVTALVTWQGADRQRKVRPSTAALHQTHQSEPSGENQPFWTSRPSKASRAKILPVDKDISLMLWDMQTAWTSRGLASGGERINHQNLLQRHCHQGSWSVVLKTKHTAAWAKLQPFLPSNVFSVDKLGYKPSILFFKKEPDWEKYSWWKIMQKLQKRCVFFLPWKQPSMPLTKTCKSVQVYSKHTVKQQEMWKENPVLKERKGNSKTQLGLRSLKSHPYLLFPACFLNESISPCL